MLVVDRHALVPVDLLDLVDEVLLGLPDALDLEQLLGVAGALDQRIAGGDLVAVGDLEADGQRDACTRPRSPSSATIVTVRPLPSSSSTRTTPEVRARVALPLGLRASKSSTTRGRPPAMSEPAMPPVWNVRMVSCVPGSPMDWAAMTPTASPTSMSLPVASEPP